MKMLAIFFAAALAAFDNLDLGVPGPCDQIVERHGYALGYSEKYEQPIWVSYRLTAEEATNAAVARSGRFLPDLAILTGSAMPSDYTRSGYDRGHLAPAGDMRFDPLAMLESFSMANMSPQLPAFNRGVWKRLEECVRMLAVRNGSLVVVTGPVFFTNTPVRVIGASRVRVPDAFYKVLYAERDPPRMIGFILPHEGSDAPLSAFCATVDQVEAATALDFYSALPPEVQSNLESRVSYLLWPVESASSKRP